MSQTSKLNQHCSVVEINQRGILIVGLSGTGKTSLALGLLERAEKRGLSSSLICDDQAILSSDGKSLVANAPKAIAGKIELRGFGVIEHPYKQSAQINLVAEICEDDAIERMPGQNHINLCDIALPHLRVPRQHEALASRIIFAWLNQFG